MDIKHFNELSYHEKVKQLIEGLSYTMMNRLPLKEVMLETSLHIIPNSFGQTTIVGTLIERIEKLAEAICDVYSCEAKIEIAPNTIRVMSLKDLKEYKPYGKVQIQIVDK